MAVFLVALLFGVRPVNAQTDCRLETSMNGFMAANSTGGVYGYYLKEVGGSTIANRNENYPFYAASTMKVFLHTYAIRNYPLNTSTSSYSGSESCDDDHTGSTPALTQSLQNALQSMMVNSNNPATNAVMEAIGDGSAPLGRSRVNNMLTNNFSLSSQTKVNHKLGCGGPANNPANTATAKDYVRFYERIMTGNYLSAPQRTTFRNLMINENRGSSLRTMLRTEIDNLVANNNLNNLTPQQIQDFKNQMQFVYKHGNWSGYGSNAGWISLPFKEGATGNIINKEYTYALFYDQVANLPVDAARITTVELLRNEVLAALQTWNTAGTYAYARASYTSEKVGELITPELGTTPDALSIIATRNTQAVTPIRDANGRLKLISWSVAYDGATIARQKSYTINSYITAVKAVALSNGRLVTAARLTNGNLQIIYWEVDNAGNFTLKDVEYAGSVGDLDLVKITYSRIATPVSTSGRDLKVIIWDIDITDKITRKGDGTVADADVVAGTAVLSSLRLATATKNKNTGNLEVQYWQVSTSGYPTLRSTASAGGISDVSMTGLSYTQFITNVIQGNTIQKSIVWEICPDGSLSRKSDDGYVGIRDIASEQTRIGKRQVVVAKDNNNRFRMSMHELGSEGEIVRTGTYTSETIGQVELAVLNSTNQLLITAYTNSTGMLKLRTWSVINVLQAVFSMSTISREDDGTSPVEFTDLEEIELATDKQRGKQVNESGIMETSLEQNYPNPFAEETQISFVLKEKGYVELKVLDLRGNEVHTLIHEEKEAGNHSLTLSGQNLPKGIYFYQLKSGDSTVVKKMIHK